MRRVITGLLLAVVLTFSVLTPALAAVDTATTHDLLLAADPGGEVGGLDPAEANDPDNDFAPESYEGNFLWGGGVGLLVIVGILFAVIGGLYWLLVVKAAEKAST